MESKNTALIVSGVVAVVLLITVVVSVRSCSDAMSDMTNVTGSSGTASLDAYNRIRSGMTYPEVVRVIGGEGTELSRVEMQGIGSTVIYAWDGKGSIGANMNATFQNGRLTAKAQFGLR